MRLEALRLLRSHVVRAADRRPEHRQLLAVVPGVLDAPEVEQLDDVSLAGAAEEEIVRLEVAVDEPARVRFVETDRDLRDHANQSLGGKNLLALEDVAQLLAVEKLHHEDPRLRHHVVLEAEDLDDVLVGERSVDLVLAPEALQRDVVLRDVLVEHLHGDSGIALLVDPLVDAAHAAVSDDPPQLVTPAEASADAHIVGRRGRRRHARGGEGGSIRRAKPCVVREDALARRAALHEDTSPLFVTGPSLSRAGARAKASRTASRVRRAGRLTPVQPRSGAEADIGCGATK